MTTSFTPFGNLTDDELVIHTLNKDDPTFLELELVNRLNYWMEHSSSLLQEVDQRLATPNKTADLV